MTIISLDCTLLTDSFFNFHRKLRALPILHSRLMTVTNYMEIPHILGVNPASYRLPIPMEIKGSISATNHLPSVWVLLSDIIDFIHDYNVLAQQNLGIDSIDVSWARPDKGPEILYRFGLFMVGITKERELQPRVSYTWVYFDGRPIGAQDFHCGSRLLPTGRDPEHVYVSERWASRVFKLIEKGFHALVWHDEHGATLISHDGKPSPFIPGSKE